MTLLPRPVARLRTLRVVVVLAVLSAVAVGTVGCRQGSADAAAEQVLIRAVVTARAEERLLRSTVDLSGEVRPWAAVTVAAETSGRVVSLEVEVGDEVRQGQVLARLDDTTSRAGEQVARAELARAKAALQQAERDLQRGQLLATTDDISDNDLEQLLTARDTAAAQRAAARGNLALAEDALADTLINAPFAGTVAERHVELGSWISPGAPLLRLLDQRRVKVHGAASQRDRMRLTVGLPVQVRLAAHPDLVFDGAVRLLGQEADAVTGTYLVEVAVDSPERSGNAGSVRLLAGMQVQLAIDLGSHQALVVPRRALLTTSDGDGLFVVRGGRARFCSPQLAAAHEELVEVAAGLEAGDQVVVVGQHVLSDGSPVRVAESGGAEDGGTPGDDTPVELP